MDRAIVVELKKSKILCLKMKKTILFLVILFVSNSIHSQNFQKGYIIKQDRDTVKGLINYSGHSNYRYCQFKDPINQDKIKYTPDNILGYGFLNDKYFESHKILNEDQSSEFVFLEVVIKGLVSLYKYDKIFYIEKGDTSFYKISNETIKSSVDGQEMATPSVRYIGLLNLLLSDCVEIRSKIPATSLSERSLTELIERYNKCMNAPVIIYKASKPWIHLRIGISGGILVSRVTLATGYNLYYHLTDTFEKTNSPVYCISFDLLSPKISENTSFHGDLILCKSHNYSFNEEKVLSTTTRNYINIDMTQLKVPIGLKYTFPGRILSAFLNVGFQSTFNLNPTSGWTRETENFYNGVNKQNYSDRLQIRKAQFGLWGGAGIFVSMGNVLNAVFEFRGEKVDGVTDSPLLATSKSSVSGFQFVIGIETK
jgi:hypothetical protein